MFSPKTPRHIVRGKSLRKTRDDVEEASSYFIDVIPKIRAHYFSDRLSAIAKGYEIMEFIQEPGQTVFM